MYRIYSNPISKKNTTSALWALWVLRGGGRVAGRWAWSASGRTAGGRTSTPLCDAGGRWGRIGGCRVRVVGDVEIPAVARPAPLPPALPLVTLVLHSVA